MNKFPKFWFEGNLKWGWISSITTLNKVFEAYEGHLTKDEILDHSKNARYGLDPHDYTNFGLRTEHSLGDKTLRQFLQENKIEV